MHIQRPEDQPDLYAIVISLMHEQGISEYIISGIMYTDPFTHSVGLESEKQRALITSALYKVLIGMTKGPAPRGIRLALNISTNIPSWIEDIKLVVLPFIKVNEQYIRFQHAQ